VPRADSSEPTLSTIFEGSPFRRVSWKKSNGTLDVPEKEMPVQGLPNGFPDSLADLFGDDFVSPLFTKIYRA
jgi:hypothetical protein